MSNLNLPINEYLEECHEQYPATYGKLIVKKILYDSGNKLVSVPDYEERGDISLRRSEYFEVKTSYLNKSGKFSIKNIRPWQNFDYFILCLIDTSNGKYRPYFYCINKWTLINNPVLVFTGQNNTKISNEKNVNVGVATTVNLDDHSWLFKNDNLFGGNTYKHLMEYLNDEYKDLTKSLKSTWDTPYQGKRAPIQKIYLKMGDLVIDGYTNMEVMTNLVKYIGPSKLDGIIWRTWLNKTYSNERCEYVGDDYYFNPKFSIRDLTTTINQINKKLNLSFKILNK